MTTKSKKSSMLGKNDANQNVNKCKFCNRVFKKESTLQIHLCEKKRRNLMKNEKWVQMGFRAFQRFYELSQNMSAPKTWEEFINSRYYLSFTRFGKFCHDLQVIRFNEYTDFVIKGGLKIDTWVDDRAYEMFIGDFQKRETIDSAIERSIKFMEQWATNYDDQWFNFFRNGDNGLLTYWLKTGRVSPWIIFNCDSGMELLRRLNNEQMSLISTMIDPRIWTARLYENRADCESVKLILANAGL